MAIAKGTCVSFCNQLKALFGYLTRVTPVCCCLQPFLGGSIWLRQESLRHILASPGYAPWTIAVNVTWIERGFNAGQTPRCSLHIPIFNHIHLQPFLRYSDISVASDQWWQVLISTKVLKEGILKYYFGTYLLVLKYKRKLVLTCILMLK